MSKEDIKRRFGEYSVNPIRRANMSIIKDLIADVAEELDNKAVDSREKALAFTKLEEAVFWAAAAIVKNTEDDTEEIRDDSVHKAKL